MKRCIQESSRRREIKQSIFTLAYFANSMLALRELIKLEVHRRSVKVVIQTIGEALKDAASLFPDVELDHVDVQFHTENGDFRRAEKITELVAELFRVCPPDEQAWCLGTLLSDGTLG